MAVHDYMEVSYHVEVTCACYLNKKNWTPHIDTIQFMKQY